ncbi:unnamed protein product, partial [Gulo gulo]
GPRLVARATPPLRTLILKDHRPKRFRDSLSHGAEQPAGYIAPVPAWGPSLTEPAGPGARERWVAAPRPEGPSENPATPEPNPVG